MEHIYESDPRRPGCSRSLCGTAWAGTDARTLAHRETAEAACAACVREQERRTAASRTAKGERDVDLPS